MEEFFELFGFSSMYPYGQTKQLRAFFFGILKRHSGTPVQMLSDVCASLFGDNVVVELLGNALLMYKPAPSLRLVRPLHRMRDKERIRKTITHIQRGAILIVDLMLTPGAHDLGSFFSDLDSTSKVTILQVISGDLERHLDITLHSWQQNQGQ